LTAGAVGPFEGAEKYGTFSARPRSASRLMLVIATNATTIRLAGDSVLAIFGLRV
jgi:hypothetical protein